MKKFHKLTALFLAALVLGTACSKKDEDTAETAKTEILTNVFRGTGMDLPAEYSINTGVKPYYDAETGEMTIIEYDLSYVE